MAKVNAIMENPTKTPRPKRNAPVTSNVDVTDSVTEVLPGQVCPVCKERKPKRLTGAARVKAFRAKAQVLREAKRDA